MTSTAPRALPDPIEEAYTSRGRRLLWPVGEADDEGYQTYAALHVSHYGRPTYSYTARLGPAKVRRSGGVVTEEVSVFGRAGIQIAREPAMRFSTKALTKVLAAARAEVEQRYAEGDFEVVALFDDDGCNCGDMACEHPDHRAGGA